MTSTPNDPTTGDYPDSDRGDVETGEGTYTNQETPEEKRGTEPDLRGPGDRGEYTDADHVAEHRQGRPGGGYTSTDHSSSGTDEKEEHPHG